jgi:predicted membrane protein DUF2306
MALTRKPDWLVPTGLIALSLIPISFGGVRLTDLAGGAEITPENARFFASPVPVVTHIISVTIYCILGAFQFHPGLRRRRPGWHRTAGRILIPSGLVAAASGLWMSQFYQLSSHDGELLYVFRMIFGFGMILSIILGLAAILQGDIARHQAWMMRGYAIALGAGTQTFTILTWILIAGEPAEFPAALLMGAGWVINLTMVEWIIRRRPAYPIREMAPPNPI